MSNSIVLFSSENFTYTKEQLKLSDCFSKLCQLKFASASLEKKVRQRVKGLTRGYEKTWPDFLYSKIGQEDRLNTLKLDFINPLVGFGVFANQAIRKYDYIGEYLGLVRRRKFFFNSDSDYVFGYSIAGNSGPWVVDAKDCGNITRFINHSYEPNTICASWIENGLSHVGFFANRRIEKGEQLTFDYGTSYWKKRPFPQTL